MPELANVNGKIVPIEQALISVEDRGVLFGDGVYEVLRTYEGRIWSFARHWRRLQRSLREIALKNVDLDQVESWIKTTYAESNIRDATIYFQISRGVAPRSHAWSESMSPTFIMTVRPFVSRGTGNQTGISAITTNDLRWGRCDIKSLNLLANVMAKQQARQQGAYEALLVDGKGRVVEGTSCAVLCLKDRVLFGPPRESMAILPSITRQFVEEIALNLGIRLQEKFVPVDEFLQADEAFIAGTGDEIMGITHVDGRPLGNGTVGENTRKIYEAYKNRISGNDD